MAATASDFAGTHKKKVLLKVIVLGDSGVGKTSLLTQYVLKKFTGQFKATIGADFLLKELPIGDQLVTLQIWDTAGQERFQSLGQAFYRGADACVLTYDMTDKKSFDSLEGWMDDFLVHCAPSNPDAFPFVVLGNKADLAAKRQVSSGAAQQFCSGKSITQHFETSAKEDSNLDVAFRAVADAALAAAPKVPVMPPIGKTIKVDDEPAPTGSKCPCG